MSRHPLIPKATHDESARFNFLTHFNRYLSGSIGASNKLAYDEQVLPAFRAVHGRDDLKDDTRFATNADGLRASRAGL